MESSLSNWNIQPALPRPQGKSAGAPGSRKRPRTSSITASIAEQHEPNQPMQFLSTTFRINSPPGTNAVSNGNTRKPKAILSCAECRRLKLKCSRGGWPCESCKKRGCPEICPKGQLASGKGSRFILANTEELHAKIQRMSERIRTLEEALAESHSSSSQERHPLLDPNLLLIKAGSECTSEDPETAKDPQGQEPEQMESPEPFSVPSFRSSPTPISIQFASAIEMDDSDQKMPSSPTPEGRPALVVGSGSISNPVQVASNSDDPDQKLSHFLQSRLANKPSNLPIDIWRRSELFPAAWTMDTMTMDRIRALLPSEEEATHLCSIARVHLLWEYNLEHSDTFLKNIIRHVYHPSEECLCSRRMAILFMVLAIGCRVDTSQPASLPNAEVYHHLARAAISEVPVFHEPNLDVLQGLFYIILYLVVFSEDNSALLYAYSLIGMAAKVAHALGLHRDSTRNKDIPEVVQRRRILFWQLLYLDARLAMSLGRPPTFDMNYVDCKQPSYTPTGATVYPSYHEWKNGFFLQSLSPIIRTIGSGMHQPAYQRILELDAITRNYPIPEDLDLFSPRGPATNGLQLVQQAMIATGRDIALLNLHRPFFTQAVNSYETFHLSHKFAPSIYATFRSTQRTFQALEMILGIDANLSARFSMLWINAISAAVALCLLVARSPGSELSVSALHELERSHQIFQRIAEHSPKASKALPLLKKLTDKSRQAYEAYLEESVHTTPTPSLTSDGSSSDVVDFEPLNMAHPEILLCIEETRSMAANGRMPTNIEEPSPLIPVSYAAPDPKAGEFSIEAFYSHGYPVSHSAMPRDLNRLRIMNQETLNVEWGAFYIDMDQSYMSWI